MNYRHSYHAGNFSDVFKHIVQIGLLQSLHKKETPFCYLETHAGAGFYDLLTDINTKNHEFIDGIAKIFNQANAPELVQQYVSYINKVNSEPKLQHYPGSPFYAQQLLRPQDRMILSELHPEEFNALKNRFHRDKQIAIHHQDGYQSLNAFLPPKERRGLVLIDPPFEKPDEFDFLPTVLTQALKLWETGIYAIWYPIKNRSVINRFYRALKTKVTRPALIVELCIYPDDIPLQLNGCGMIIVNPPWQLEQTLENTFPWVWNKLSKNQAGHFKQMAL